MATFPRKKFDEWLESYQHYTTNYNPNQDGPPLEPDTIAGAQVQIAHLASNLRTTFGLDPQFDKNLINQVAEMLDSAAGALGQIEPRNVSHKFNRTSQQEPTLGTEE